MAPLVNASTGTEAMFLLPVESEHIERGQELRFICTHSSDHGTCKTVLVDTGEPSGISLLKLNYEFTCCIISVLTPFICLFVFLFIQCVVVGGSQRQLVGAVSLLPPWWF